MFYLIFNPHYKITCRKCGEIVGVIVSDDLVRGVRCAICRGSVKVNGVLCLGVRDNEELREMQRKEMERNFPVPKSGEELPCSPSSK